VYGLERYAQIISLLKGHNRAFTRFPPGPEVAPRTICLRHDIDFSIEDALRVAVLEEELEVTATYFFMLSSNMYNLLSSRNQQSVREIARRGHTISLHFDPSAHYDLDAGFAAEKQVFERTFEVPVEVVSLHRPGSFLEDNNRVLPGARHTYQDEYIRDMHYLSDSAGRDIQSKIEEAAPLSKPLHLLIHLIWWTINSGSANATLLDWLDRNNSFLFSETRRNCRTFTG